MTFEDEQFDEDHLYDQFPRGASTGFGVAEGFNTWICVNDASLFRPEVLESNPVIRAFVTGDFWSDDFGSVSAVAH